MVKVTPPLGEEAVRLPSPAVADVTVRPPFDAVTVTAPLVPVTEAMVRPPLSAVMVTLRGATIVPRVRPVAESVSCRNRSWPMVALL